MTERSDMRPNDREFVGCASARAFVVQQTPLKQVDHLKQPKKKWYRFCRFNEKILKQKLSCQKCRLPLCEENNTKTGKNELEINASGQFHMLLRDV